MARIPAVPDGDFGSLKGEVCWVDLVNDRPQPFWEYWERSSAPRGTLRYFLAHCQWFPTPATAPQGTVRPENRNAVTRLGRMVHKVV